MKRPLKRSVLLPLLMLGLSPGSAHADACAHSFKFSLTTEGPWPAYGRTRKNTACTSWFLSGGATVYKQLYLAEKPQHGSVGLKQGGYFTYSPAADFVGADRFLLRVCGTIDRQEGCSNLAFNMTVVP